MDCDQSEFLMDLGECDHSPLRPPRDGFVGENVFAQRWKELMKQSSSPMVDCSNHMLVGILLALPGTLRQRHATVAASFIAWLGTNCGRAFLHEAKRLDRLMRPYSSGYLAAWANENHRKIGINGTLTTAEHFLAQDDRRGSGYLGLCHLMRAPDLTHEDYETIEHVVYWLGSDEGEKFTHRCEVKIRRLAKLDRDKRLREFAEVLGNKQLLKLLNEGN